MSVRHGRVSNMNYQWMLGVEQYSNGSKWYISLPWFGICLWNIVFIYISWRSVTMVTWCKHKVASEVWCQTHHRSLKAPNEPYWPPFYTDLQNLCINTLYRHIQGWTGHLEQDSLKVPLSPIPKSQQGNCGTGEHRYTPQYNSEQVCFNCLTNPEKKKY